MSNEERAGKVIRQTYAAFWKELILLGVSVVFILHPEVIYGWIETRTGAAISEGLPIDRILQGLGLLGAFYAIVIGIGYDLLANRYILTDEEVIEVYGIIQKNRRVTKLEHIRRVSVRIGFVGRILGFGDVLYYTSGSGGVDVRLRDISNPEALAEEADRLARRKQDESGSGEPWGRTPPDGEMLDSFSESQDQSINIQRQILQTLIELRDEARLSRRGTGGEAVESQSTTVQEEPDDTDHEEDMEPGWATPNREAFYENESQPESHRVVHRSLT